MQFHYIIHLDYLRPNVLVIINLIETLDNDNFATFYNTHDSDIGDWNILMQIQSIEVQTDFSLKLFPGVKFNLSSYCGMSWILTSFLQHQRQQVAFNMLLQALLPDQALGPPYVTHALLRMIL